MTALTPVVCGSPILFVKCRRVGGVTGGVCSFLHLVACNVQKSAQCLSLRKVVGERAYERFNCFASGGARSAYIPGESGHFCINRNAFSGESAGTHVNSVTHMQHDLQQ